MGSGGECDEGVANEVRECRGGTLIAGWAVGGEVSCLVYIILKRLTLTISRDFNQSLYA